MWKSSSNLLRTHQTYIPSVIWAGLQVDDISTDYLIANEHDRALSIDIADKNGCLEICEFLIENICNIPSNNIENGTTILHLAAWCCHLEMCELIIQIVDNKNPTDQSDQTPLNFAAIARFAE